MEYIYAALLLHKLGKPIEEESLKKVIAAAGVEVDEGKIKTLVTSLKDVDIDKELETATIPVSTGGEATSGGESGGKEEKKEEKEEVKPEEAAEGLASLFG